MGHAENEIIISKPVDIVYGFVADGLNNPKWRPGVISIELATGQAGKKGAEYRQMLKGPGGRSINGSYKITVAEPGNELSFAVIAGPARPTGNFYFVALEDNTKVQFVLNYKPKGLAKLMEPMITKTMQTEVALLTNLKQVIEAA
jgi:uncharacterized membrane protein